MEREVTLRIVLEQPPAGVDFGLQQGRGSVYETVQTQRSKDEDLSFEFAVGVRTGMASVPDYSGPFVQGPRGGRFVDIDIGTLAGQSDSQWTRRLKIPFTGITWDMIDRAAADARSLLETRVPGMAKDGGPNCATVKPFDGWKLGRARLREQRAQITNRRDR